MYRLLIVDDERYIVESMYELISAHEELDLEILTTCYGDEALELLRSQRIDLVLLDINMPGISGLEIAAQIQENWRQCRIIFLTGYAEFDYAYQSTKYEHASFLLKTESNQTILNTIKDTIQSLEQEEAHKRLVTRDQFRSIYLNYLLYRESIYGLLMGKQYNNFKEEVLKLPGDFELSLDREVFLLSMHMEPGQDILTEEDAENREALSPANKDYPMQIVQIIRFFNSCFQQRCQVALSVMDRSHAVILIQFKEDASVSVKEGISFIRECLNGRTSDPAFLGLKPVFLLPEMAFSWEQLASAWRRLLLYYDKHVLVSFPQSGQIITVKSDALAGVLTESGKAEEKLPQELSARLQLGLSVRDEKQIGQALLLAGEFFKTLKSLHQLEGILLYHALSNVFIEYILHHSLEEKLAFHIGLFRLYNPGQFNSWEQVIAYFKELSELILSMTEHEEQDARSQILEQIKAYVKANLSRNITLSDIAASVCYNSSHVSRFFHQMTGQTLSQYILQCRMDAACSYLAAGSDSIQAISENLGYESAQYFSNVFKKYTGMSPREYRNAKQNPSV